MDSRENLSALRVDPSTYDSSQILVSFREEAAAQRGANILAGAQLGRPIGLVPGLRSVRLPAGVSVEAALKAYRASPLVRYAEPDYRVYLASATPDDPNLPQLYGLNNTGQTGGTADDDIDAFEAWDINTGSPDVIVGVIDTGVDYNHQDLAANIWTNPGEIPGNSIDDDGNGYVDDVHGINAIVGSGDPMDDNGHGTHVSGTIGAAAFNEGVVGVNWRVSIIGLKFLDAGGYGSTSDAIECFDYLNDLKLQGHNIVASNNSWGGGEFSQALADAIDGPAGMADILHVFAAGNSGTNNDSFPFYPASYTLPNMLSVAATDHNDQYAGFSSYGATSVDLAAPGVDILSTVPGNGYAYLSGTSMATPHVTGAAALVASTFSGSTAAQIKQRILAGVDPLGNQGKPTVTNGRLNVANALSGGTPDLDSTPPDAVDDLTASGSSLFSVALNWTATGDDGSTGIASYYDVRYSTSPISSEADWASAAKAIGEPGPQPSGSTETFVVAGLDHSTAYYFAVRVRDNLGNQSALSGSVLGSTATATVLFEEDMESGAPGWSADGFPGLWHLSDRRSTSPDTSFYYGDEASGTYDVGYSYGYLTSPAIDLTGVSEALLTFNEWRQVENYAPYDGAYLLASSDGVSWQTIWQSYYSTGDWVQQTVDLSPWAGGSVYLQYYFDTYDDAYNWFEGWYLDDVSVLAPGAPVPGLYIGNASVTEGNAPGTVNASFQVKLTGASGPVSVDWATADGTATAAGNDYAPESGTINFAGDGTQTITVVVNGDAVDELNETFFVHLSNASGTDIVDGEGRGEIADDDAAGISLSAPSGLVTTESAQTATFHVALTSQPAANVTINLLSGDTTEGTVSPASLIFTPANWNSPQAATVTGVNDLVDDGDVSYLVSATAASSDGAYSGLSNAISAQNIDNEFSVTYTSTNVPRNIPDNGSVTSSLAVASHMVLDVDVRLSISHPRNEDVDVHLTGPTGTKVELFTDVGGAGNNFTNTGLDDEASAAITSAAAPFSGVYRPEGSLAAFDNKNSLGTWVLSVADDKKGGGQKGTLNQWSVTILYEQASGGASGQTADGRPATAGFSLAPSLAQAHVLGQAQSAAPALSAVVIDRLFAAAARDFEPSRSVPVASLAAKEIVDTRRESSYLDLFGNSSHWLSTKDRGLGAMSRDGGGSTPTHQLSSTGVFTTGAVDAALEDLMGTATRKRGR